MRGEGTELQRERDYYLQLANGTVPLRVQLQRDSRLCEADTNKGEKNGSGNRCIAYRSWIFVGEHMTTPWVGSGMDNYLLGCRGGRRPPTQVSSGQAAWINISRVTTVRSVLCYVSERVPSRHRRGHAGL